MKRYVFLSALVSVVLLSSFTGRNHPSGSATAAGKYGVSDTGTLPFIFELLLNADNTFHYVNNSVPGKAIDVTGTWEQSGNVITLSNYTSPFPINKKWKMDGDKCLKSRKGLEFTRLCHIQ